VPTDDSQWRTEPFAASKDEHGNIYARGTQDMKSVCIQHLLAVANLKQKNKEILRNLYLTFVPDEEIGGVDGMAKFVEHVEFASLNVGVALDEGLASPDETMTVFYGERAAWWVSIKSVGPTGHGSRFIQETAVEKLMRVVNRLLAFRKSQFDELQRGIAQCGMKLGDVTTVNLTALKAGVTTDGKTFSLNVIPTEAMAGFDIRIPPTVDLDEFEKQLKEWTNEEGITYEFVQGHATRVNKSTDISEDSKWWNIFRSSLQKQNVKIDPQIFPAATDSRYIREKNIPAFGFSPINNTPILLHDHNEFINEKVFLRGIEIFETIILDLVNTPPQ